MSLKQKLSPVKKATIVGLAIAVTIAPLVYKILDGFALLEFGGSAFKPLQGEFWNKPEANRLIGITIPALPKSKSQQLIFPKTKTASREFLIENLPAIRDSLKLAKSVPIKIEADYKTPYYYNKFVASIDNVYARWWLLTAAVSAMNVGDYEQAEEWMNGYLSLYLDLRDRPLNIFQNQCASIRIEMVLAMRDYLVLNPDNEQAKTLIRKWAAVLIERPKLSTHDYIAGVYSQDLCNADSTKYLKRRYDRYYKSSKVPGPRFSREFAERVAGNLATKSWRIEESYPDWSFFEAKAVSLAQVSRRGMDFITQSLPVVVMESSLSRWYGFEQISLSFFFAASLVNYVDFLDWAGQGKRREEWKPGFDKFGYGFQYAYEFVAPNQNLDFFQTTEVERGGMLFQLVDGVKKEPWPAYNSGVYFPFPVLAGAADRLEKAAPTK